MEIAISVFIGAWFIIAAAVSYVFFSKDFKKEQSVSSEEGNTDE